MHATRLVLILVSMFFVPKADANIGVMLTAGQASNSEQTKAWRHGIFYDFNHKWFVRDNQHLTWQLELTHSRWENHYFPNINVVSLNPVFHYVWQQENFAYYAGLGIGAAKLDDTRLIARRLGSKWLFEDQLIAGIKINKHHTIAVSFIHYSNADLASTNAGISFMYLNYSFAW